MTTPAVQLGDPHAYGADLIAAERQRQIEAEGWTPDHDDAHTLGELAVAGACYALLGSRWRDASVLGRSLLRGILWPWEAKWFKPAQYPDDPPFPPSKTLDIKNLVRAGALIAAEIDRLQRAGEPAGRREQAAEEIEQLPEGEFIEASPELKEGPAIDEPRTEHNEV